MLNSHTDILCSRTKQITSSVVFPVIDWSLISLRYADRADGHGPRQWGESRTYINSSFSTCLIIPVGTCRMCFYMCIGVIAGELVQVTLWPTQAWCSVCVMDGQFERSLDINGQWIRANCDCWGLRVLSMCQDCWVMWVSHGGVQGIFFLYFLVIIFDRI